MLFLCYLQGVCQAVIKLSLPPWLARELKPNRKLFPHHLSSILHCALSGCWFTHGLLVTVAFTYRNEYFRAKIVKG